MSDPIPPQPPILPYAAPRADPGLYKIAVAQRRIMWIILCAILLMVSFAFGAAITPSGNGAIVVIAIISLLRVGIVVMMMVGIYQLSAALGNSTGTSVLFVIGMLIPCVSLIILLVINQKATKTLTDNNIKVGLMGARLSDIPLEDPLSAVELRILLDL